MKTCLLFFLCSFIGFTIPAAIAQVPSFKTYKVNIYNGPQTKLIIKGNPLAEMYRTTIKETYYSKALLNRRGSATGLNFAGHYCFLWWGCGSDCQHAALVDVKTGVVYDGPTAERRFKFERWSKLVIVNPPGNNNDCSFCTTEYWLWNENKHRFNRIR